MMVSEEKTRKAIDTIMGAVLKGDIGDGTIFVTAVANAIQARTGEEADQAP